MSKSRVGATKPAATEANATQRYSFWHKALCVLVSIALVLGLNPAAGLVQPAYADDATGGG